MSSQSLDALIVTSLPNIAYITGFFASAGVLLVISADAHRAHRRQPLRRAARRPRAASGRRFARRCSIPAVSFDAAVVDALEPFADAGWLRGAATHGRAAHRYITHELAKRGWTDELLCDGRRRRRVAGRARTSGRSSASATAARACLGVAKCILPKVLAGRTEADVAAEIEAALRRRAGFERPAFDTIVASGPNAALPHARAGERPIGDGELVVVDFGGVLDGYCTDLTRTVVAGRIGERASAS